MSLKAVVKWAVGKTFLGLGLGLRRVSDGLKWMSGVLSGCFLIGVLLLEKWLLSIYRV